MQKLSSTEGELKKGVAYKKACSILFLVFCHLKLVDKTRSLKKLLGKDATYSFPVTIVKLILAEALLSPN